MDQTKRSVNTPLKRVYRSRQWSDRELLQLATAVQNYGFEETDKIAATIGTKDENAVKAYIKIHVNKLKEKLNHGSGRRMSLLNVKSKEDIKNWPNVRKWQKIAQNQMMVCTRKQDYSRILIEDLCKRFYDEAEEPGNPQIANVKSMYKFMLDCVSGRVPAELPPIESAIILMLIKKLKEMRDTMELTEEFDFLNSFRKATTFTPFKVKDEFKKKEHTDPEIDTPGAMRIPEEVYTVLSRHRKVVQSFNPLMVPIWLFDKEQMQLLNSNDSPCSSVTRTD